jgi:hypothetical protein
MEKTKTMTPSPQLRQVEAVGEGRDWFMGCGPLAVRPAPFLYFFSSIFSILLFYNSMLEFKSVLDDLEHMNLAKNILGY